MQESLTSINVINKILKKYNFHTTKTLGQNFLIDANIVDNILNSAEVSKNDIIIEIGPGIGSMTQQLLKNSNKVYSIEIDNRLYPILEENFRNYDNFVLIKSDFLELDLKDFIERIKLENALNDETKIKVVANLPYYISTAIIMKLLESNIEIETMVFMLQKEVAYRIGAKKDSKDYGILSIMCQYFSVPKICFKVSKNCFIPKPNVDSVVIRLDLNKEKKLSLKDFLLFQRVVKGSFNKRRKTLINSLGTYENFNKMEVENLLEKLGIDKNIRAENLSIDEFIAIAFELKNRDF